MNKIKEKQCIRIVITTEGDKCEMTTEEIKSWYEESIMKMFNMEYGVPKIDVKVTREIE